MNEKESIQIISEMIAKAKASHHRKSYYFIIWGIILAIASLTEFVVVHQLQNTLGYFAWMLAGITGGIITMIYSKNETKRKGHEAYMDQVYQSIWGAFGISLLLLIVLSVLHKLPTNPLVLLLTGMPVFISGSLTKFKPLIIGAIIFWLTGTFGFFVEPKHTSLLFFGAIVFGYLLPGFLLMKTENNNA